MAMIQNAFANSSFSLLVGKIQGTIVDYLMPPLSTGELIAGLVGAAVTRAFLVGFAVWLAMLLWPGVSRRRRAIRWAVLWFGLMGALMLAFLGLLTSIWAEKFDHAAAVDQFRRRRRCRCCRAPSIRSSSWRRRSARSATPTPSSTSSRASATASSASAIRRCWSARSGCWSLNVALWAALLRAAEERLEDQELSRFSRQLSDVERRITDAFRPPQANAAHTRIASTALKESRDA